MAITSAKRIGELQAFSSVEPYTTFLEDKVLLKFLPTFTPKCPSFSNLNQLVTIPRLPVDLTSKDTELASLDVVRCLKIYLQRTQEFRRSENLFISFSGKNKGLKASKPSISGWISECINLSYHINEKDPPEFTRAHSTRSVASSWAERALIPLEQICQSASWSTPRTFFKHYRIAASEPSGIKHFGRYSQLILVNASAADTGEFSCGGYQCSGHDCHDGEEKTGKTFVFVTDPQELFVPTEDYYVVVQLRTRQPALLPCQVTNPLAKVTLHREFPPEQVPVDGVKIAFDLKKGFVIYQPQPSLVGSLFCIAELGNLRQMSTKYMLIYVHYPSAPPKPTIEASVKSARTGENFVVTCTVLGELEISVDFTWEYPGQQIGRPPYVREHTSQTRRGGQLLQESESTLYIDEARAVDDGTYTCTAQNLQGSTSVTTRVTILPATSSTTRERTQG
ncbi:platelet-derived growth factor receptor-like protein [Dendropsophus ebraccatus]|uniref:platelet-derived growth factor receptor-like protein n=1 Tax=Dendropsophus ebraccatus TaxID=150705 RepID=UPI0038316FFF